MVLVVNGIASPWLWEGGTSKEEVETQNLWFLTGELVGVPTLRLREGTEEDSAGMAVEHHRSHYPCDRGAYQATFKPRVRRLLLNSSRLHVEVARSMTVEPRASSP